jgi:hypothetical protein
MAVVAYRRAKPAFNWTNDEVRILKFNAVIGETIEDTAREIGRPLEAVARKATELRLSFDIAGDINDGKPWSEIDIRDLRGEIDYGRTIEEAATHLCRAGTVDEVAAKARELGLNFRRGDGK